MEEKTESLLENDLGTNVTISELYYNKKLKGCFVEFETDSYYDSAAVHLDSKEIDYESEFDYYSAIAEELRNDIFIDEEALHEANNNVISLSSYAEWSFTIAIMEANGDFEYNGWKKLK